MKRLKRILYILSHKTICLFTEIIIDGFYGGFWEYRLKAQLPPLSRLKMLIYSNFMNQHSCYIGIGAKFQSVPVLPHGFNGIHISAQAILGENVVIFQQVTIGSNTITGHPRFGSPIIGNNVYIGAGAKIIGKVTIGDNCRIGANAVVVKDMEPNTTAVAASTRYIHHDTILDNTFNTISTANKV